MGKIDKPVLEQLYLVEHKTGNEIANFYECSSTHIYNLLKKYNVPIRNKYDCQKSIIVSESELKKLYLINKKSCYEISDIFNCNEETIRRLLDKHGIERRKKTWKFGGHNKGKKTPPDVKEKISNARKRLYKNGTLKHWNKGNAWGLEVKKKISNTLKGKMIGSLNPNWKGGDSNEHRLWRRRIEESLEYREFRKDIFKRDEFKCQLCNKESSGDLQLHHILPVKKYKKLLMVKDNGITLCKNCHGKIWCNEGKYVVTLSAKI